jgi:hypothetical protein
MNLCSSLRHPSISVLRVSNNETGISYLEAGQQQQVLLELQDFLDRTPTSAVGARGDHVRVVGPIGMIGNPPPEGTRLYDKDHRISAQSLRTSHSTYLPLLDATVAGNFSGHDKTPPIGVTSLEVTLGTPVLSGDAMGLNPESPLVPSGLPLEGLSPECQHAMRLAPTTTQLGRTERNSPEPKGKP